MIMDNGLARSIQQKLFFHVIQVVFIYSGIQEGRFLEMSSTTLPAEDQTQSKNTGSKVSGSFFIQVDHNSQSCLVFGESIHGVI